MIPKETDSGFDIGSDMIGAGPLRDAERTTPSRRLHDEAQPGVLRQGLGARRHDRVPDHPENARQLAQLKAGNICTTTSAAVGRRHAADQEGRAAQLNLYDTDMPNTHQRHGLRPGWPTAASRRSWTSACARPFSMAWDRDLYIDTFYNVSKFKQQACRSRRAGTRRSAADLDGWWLDPQGQGLRRQRQVLQARHRRGEEAAGGGRLRQRPRRTCRRTTSRPTSWPTCRSTPRCWTACWASSASGTKVNPVDYAKEYIPRFRDGKGQYEGMGIRDDGRRHRRWARGHAGERVLVQGRRARSTASAPAARTTSRATPR